MQVSLSVDGSWPYFTLIDSYNTKLFLWVHMMHIHVPLINLFDLMSRTIFPNEQHQVLHVYKLLSVYVSCHYFTFN